MRPLRALWRVFLYLRFRIFQRHRFNRLVVESVGGIPILVLPTVFHPKLFFSTEFLIRGLDGGRVCAGKKVLDLGTGSGAVAVAAARHARQVVAVDLNPAAVRCARINALLNQVEDRVEVRSGDLFEPVAGDAFDLILFNPPYLSGSPADQADLGFRGEDVAARFASGLGSCLKPGGEALVVLSSRGRMEEFLEQFRLHRLGCELAARQDLFSEVLKLFRLRRPDGGSGYTQSPTGEQTGASTDRW